MSRKEGDPLIINFHTINSTIHAPKDVFNKYMLFGICPNAAIALDINYLARA